MSDPFCYNILIVGDSRARFLQQALNQTTLNLHFEVHTLPGAKIAAIALKTLAELSYQNSFHLVIIMGGINNITKLQHYPSKHAVPRYAQAQDLIEYTLVELKTAMDKIRAISEVPSSLATLAGIDLGVYSPTYHDLLRHFQPMLNSAIVEINKRIRGINRLTDNPTLDLAYPVHRCKGKSGQYRTQYSLLHDGLHPSEALLNKWAIKIQEFCVQNLPYVHHR